MKFLFLTALFCAAASLAADTMTVTVSCTNGQRVRGLPITVYDSTRQQVTGVSQTDNQGVFVIENSETYTAPFYLWFTSPQGSSCGAYSVISNGLNVGYVALNYYPTELPCSCSRLTD